ncbi:MAG: gamma-glutamyl-gamma-aminobutyrate hydrolase family protein [Chlamydiia bacterium]|nr:gamma-glutamyl-gamma-aminobutyrate hydrolase family protein [Chlamydiia bacterium]
MADIKESISSLDYRHQEILFNSLTLNERQKVVRSLKNEKEISETDKTAAAIFEKIKKAENYPINISRETDRRSIIALANKKLRSALDEIAYFFGFYTARKAQRLASKYLKNSTCPSNETVKSISETKLKKILAKEKEANFGSDTIDLKAVLQKNGYPLVVSDCTFDQPDFFSEVNLNGIIFENCEFTECHFSNASLTEVTFETCTLSNISFLNAKMSTCRFHHCNLQEVMFTGAIIDSSEFSLCSIIGNSFEDASITSTEFINSTLAATHFLEVSTEDSSFIKCNLKDAVFFGALNNFFVDEKSIETAVVTGPTSVMLVDPESRGISTPKAYMKLDQKANTIPLRITLKAQKTSPEKVNIEIKTALTEIGPYDRDKLPISQQLIKKITENPNKYVESIKILKKVEKLATEVDSFFLPGGEDVPPALYGQLDEEHTDWGNDYRRSILELGIIHQSFNKGIPLMGVCRGFQMANIYFGAQLLQHVEGHKGIQKFQLVSNEHKGIYDNALKDSIHSAVYHHQAISQDNGPTDYLEPSVIYQNLIKASELKHAGANPMILLQFHPEFHKATTADDMTREWIDKGLEMTMSESNETFWDILSESAKSYRNKKITLLELMKTTSNIRGLQRYESDFDQLEKGMLPEKLRKRTIEIENLEKEMTKAFNVFQRKNYDERCALLQIIINKPEIARRYLQLPEEGRLDRYSEERASILAALKGDAAFRKQLGTEKLNCIMSIIREVNPELLRETI